MEDATTLASCSICGKKSATRTVISFNGKGIYCSNKCREKGPESIAYNLASQKHFAARRAEFWREVPPRSMQTLDLKKRERPAHFDFVVRWNSDSSNGLVLVGDTGLGKTWATYALAAELYVEERSFEIWRGVDFQKEVVKRSLSDESDDYEKWVDNLCELEVLFLDDMDKMPPTQKSVSTLFDVIDRRTLDNAPTIISLNTRSQALIDHLDSKVKKGVMYGGPIVRRLCDYFTAVDFDILDIIQAIRPPAVRA